MDILKFTELAGNSSWPDMLGKMEETLGRLLAEEETKDLAKPKVKDAPKTPYSEKESRLLHRLDQHLGNLEASLQRAEQIAQESEAIVNDAVEKVERWQDSAKLLEKKGNSKRS